MQTTIRIKIPEEYIGKWCLCKEYGTHGAYAILIENGMVFDSKEHAEEYKKWKYQDNAHIEIWQIKQNYPVWQTTMFVCGLDVNELKKINNEQ